MSQQSWSLAVSLELRVSPGWSSLPFQLSGRDGGGDGDVIFQSAKRSAWCPLDF
jgi:hypothetical protein